MRTSPRSYRSATTSSEPLDVQVCAFFASELLHARHLLHNDLPGRQQDPGAAEAHWEKPAVRSFQPRLDT